jgi:hypothetical protein
MWEKAKDNLNQAESAAYINLRRKKCIRINTTYVYDVKKSVSDGIGDIVSFLESASRSVLYSLQSSITFLDVKDKYRIPDMYDHKHLDTGTSTRGFATKLCVGVDYWSRIHIDKDFYYTTLSCLSKNTDDNSILFYFVFLSYRVAVPMCSGDVVCFNPLINQCCTDPTKHGIKKFSCYVSAKTCNAQIALTHGNGETL